MSLAYPFLPTEIGDKISDYSNQDLVPIARQVPQRDQHARLLGDEEEQRRGSSPRYLTWRELIHTSYFEVPEFRKLLAYASARSTALPRPRPSRPNPTTTGRRAGTGRLGRSP